MGASRGVLEVRVGVHGLMSAGAWRWGDVWRREHEAVHGTVLVCVSRRPSCLWARCAASAHRQVYECVRSQLQRGELDVVSAD